jgi:hypothetical protein
MVPIVITNVEEIYIAFAAKKVTSKSEALRPKVNYTGPPVVPSAAVLRGIPSPAPCQSTSISRLEGRWGIATNVIWISNPDGRVREVFPSEYVGKIRSITYGGKAANMNRHATVRFDTIEDASLLIQALSSLVLKTAVRRE